jgi:transposase-like protein
MRRRKWDSKAKAMIILQGLKGKPLAELCTEHHISQAQYYDWRDQFLRNANRAFDGARQTQRETHQTQEIQRLKALVGELTLELKKNDEVYG